MAKFFSVRRWFQFKLRTLLVLVAVAALGSNWILTAHRQTAALRSLMSEHGVSPWYSFQVDSEGDSTYLEPSWFLTWLQNNELVDYVYNIESVYAEVPDDAVVESLSSLRHLKFLQVSSCELLTDRGFSALASLRHLRRLQIGQPNFELPEKGIAALAELKRLQRLELAVPAGLEKATVGTILQLPNLRRLAVWFAAAPGAEVAMLSKLEHLEQLEVTAQGDAWTELPLGQCQALKRLVIFNYRGSDFDWFDHLPKIESLQLFDCPELIGQVLERLSHLPRLRELTLSSCEKVTLEHVKGMSQLELLQVHDCPLTGSRDLPQIAGLSKLNRVSLDPSANLSPSFRFFLENNGLDESPSSRRANGSATGVRRLELGNCRIESKDLDGLNSLEELVCEQCRFVPEPEDRVCHLPALRRLDLEIPTELPLWLLAGNDALEAVRIQNPQSLPITEFEHLRAAANLRKLTIRGQLSSIVDTTRLLGELSALRTLEVRTWSSMTDANLAALAASTSLEKLALVECDNITGQGVAALSKATNLVRLDLVQCPRVSLGALEGFAKLKHLACRDCAKCSDADMAAVCGLTGLEFLEISNADQLSDAGLQAITKLANLRAVELNGCEQLTNDGLLVFKQLPRLRSLRLVRSNSLNAATIKNLQSSIAEVSIWGIYGGICGTFMAPQRAADVYGEVP